MVRHDVRDLSPPPRGRIAEIAEARHQRDAESFTRARNAEDVADLSVVHATRGWLDDCLCNHSPCGQRQLGKVFSPVENILLIDVVCLKLIHAHTTFGNLTDLSQPNSLHRRWNEMPRVIQDAINFTAALGECFLWVDSLCIVQDCAHSKHQQLELMAEIYNSATLTLIAGSGIDASYPLISSQAAATVARRCFSTTSHDQEFQTPLNYSYDELPSAEDTVESIATSKYNERGWTYQERLLSRRRVYFLDQSIVFHCRSDYLTPIELMPQTKPRADHDSALRRRNPMKQKKDWEAYRASTQLKWASRRGAEWPSTMTPESFAECFLFWMEMVREYSQKTLTDERDILRACTGVLEAFRGYSEWPIQCGMPIPLLELALHWTVNGTAWVRKSKNHSYDDFPSWSWMAWKGGVNFLPISDGTTLYDLRSRLDFSEDKKYSKDWIPNLRRHVTVVEGVLRVDASHLEANRTQPQRMFMPSVDHYSCNHTIIFSAFVVPATAFTIDKDAYSGNMPMLKDAPKDWRWLVGRGHEGQAPPICGVIYDISAELTDGFNEPRYNPLGNSLEPKYDLLFVLLSDTRESSNVHVNQVLAASIASHKLEDMRAPLKPGNSALANNSGTQDNDMTDDQMNSWETPINSSGRPLGTIRNEMLVRHRYPGHISNCEGHYKRLGIAQIIGRSWDTANPTERKISLH